LKLYLFFVNLEIYKYSLDIFNMENKDFKTNLPRINKNREDLQSHF